MWFLLFDRYNSKLSRFIIRRNSEITKPPYENMCRYDVNETCFNLKIIFYKTQNEIQHVLLWNSLFKNDF